MALGASRADAVAEDLSPHAAAVAPLHRATRLNKAVYIFINNFLLSDKTGRTRSKCIANHLYKLARLMYALELVTTAA